VNILLEFAVPLISGVLIALIWANLSYGTYVVMTQGTLHFVVNELFMALFFGIAAKEIRESFLPEGKLYPIRSAVNPLIATMGGVAIPALTFLVWTHLSDDPAIGPGWGIPTATDIALAWLVARVVFGKGHPAVSFLLLLAIADDGIGLAIIAIFYPDPNHPINPTWLGLVLLGMIMTHVMRKKKVTHYCAYLLLPAPISWYGLYAAHLHPALALVFLIPLMPHAKVDYGLFVDTGHDTLSAFEHTFKKPVDIGLFAFGLTNAGVPFSSIGNVTWAVLMSLLVGKTVGVFGFGYLAHLCGMRLPKGINARILLVVGMNAALGLTVALFVAGVAFPPGELQGAAKMGALLSICAAPITIVMGRLLRVKERG